MNDFKEFQGKSLDEAIRGACAYYNTPREKLEIDIVQDAKTGIFSVIFGGGARKAIIRARRVQLKNSVGSLLGRSETPIQKTNSISEKGTPTPAQKTLVSQKIQETVPPDETLDDSSHIDDDFADGLNEFGVRPFSPGLTLCQLDQEELNNCVQNVASRIINGILGEIPVQVNILEHRVDVRVECGDESGILIGREGQTLAALQYLVSRIVSRQMGALVRVQFDVGDYRQRQDERLRILALNLAERVRFTGHSCSTRPMSSYHRRIVHMTLQDQPDIYTRSSGEGSMKRIIIQRRRPESPENVSRSRTN